MRGSRYFSIVSAGPDRRFGTEDDLAVVIDVNEGDLFTPGGRGAIAVKIDHDRGPFNGLAQITGTVVDPSGANVAGAQINLEAIANGQVRHATADRAGAWALRVFPQASIESLSRRRGSCSRRKPSLLPREIRLSCEPHFMSAL